jgi:hypothetical protein
MNGPWVPADFLDYDSDVGILRWRILPASMFQDGKYSAERNCKAWNGQNGGKEAFTALDGHGYRQGTFNGVHMRVHKLIWILQFGRPPIDRIDYIDGDKTNIKISNLRDVSQTTDGRNAAMKSNNTSGYSGVSFDKSRGLWMAKIKVCGTSKFLGRFKEISSAVSAYEAAKVKHGFSPRHGIKNTKVSPDTRKRLERASDYEVTP